MYIIYALKAMIFMMWDYLGFFLVTGDMAQQETSDRAVKLHALDITYTGGYVATSD